MDKIIVGLAVYVVTHTPPYQKDEDFTDDDLQFIRLTMSLVPGLACVIATIGILFCPVPEYTSPEMIADVVKAQENEASETKLLKN